MARPRRKNAARPSGKGARGCAGQVLSPSAPSALVRSVPPFGGARRCRGSRYARHIGWRKAPISFGWRADLRHQQSFKLRPAAVR